MPNATGSSSSSPRDEFTSDASQDGNGNFSLDKFYTASSDKKGRQTTVQVHVPPSLLRTIQEIVARRIIPEYRTSADVLRDLLVVGAHMRLDQIDEPDFTRDVEIMRQRAEIETWQAAREEEEQTVDAFEKALKTADSPEEVRKIRERILAAVPGVVSTKQRERLERMAW